MDFAVIGATTKKGKEKKKKETRKEGRLFHETNFRSFMYLPGESLRWFIVHDRFRFFSFLSFSFAEIVVLRQTDLK